MKQAIPFSISQSDIKSLDKLYTLRERTETLEFINKYPFLVPVLLEAPKRIYQYFPDSQLFLEAIPDPEMVNYVQLVLSILITLEPEDAVDRLNQLDREWWHSVPHEVWQHLCVIVEYPDDF